MRLHIHITWDYTLQCRYRGDTKLLQQKWSRAFRVDGLADRTWRGLTSIRITPLVSQHLNYQFPYTVCFHILQHDSNLTMIIEWKFKCKHYQDYTYINPSSWVTVGMKTCETAEMMSVTSKLNLSIFRKSHNDLSRKHLFNM